MIEKPKCQRCSEDLEDGETAVRLSDVHIRGNEIQGGAGGGVYHPECAIEWIEEIR